MANNFYTATSTLLRAYQDISNEHGVIELNGVEVFRVPNRTELYSELLGFDKPTLSEKLLAYTELQDEVFLSKETEANQKALAAQKDADAVDYILRNLEHVLPDIDSPHYKLTPEELQETYNELFTSTHTSNEELPKFGNPFDDEDSRNQNPLEPNKGEQDK